MPHVAPDIAVQTQARKVMEALAAEKKQKEMSRKGGRSSRKSVEKKALAQTRKVAGRRAYYREFTGPAENGGSVGNC